MTTPDLKRFFAEAAGVVAFCFVGAWAVGCECHDNDIVSWEGKPFGYSWPVVLSAECRRSTHEPVVYETPGSVVVTCVPRADGGAR